MSYNSLTTTIGLHRSMYADLYRHFSHIAAWGAYLGSLDSYVQREIDIAARDNAPDDVVFRTDWHRLTEAQQARAFDNERDGFAYIARDDQGQPVRKWSRASAFGHIEHFGNSGHMVTAMAGRIRSTGSPWSQGINEQEDSGYPDDYDYDVRDLRPGV